MPFIHPRFRATFLALFCVFTLFGTSMTIIGATLPKILADFQWSYIAAGLVIGASAVTYFFGTFAAGYLIKHWGAKPTIVFGLLLDVAGLTFFASMPSPFANALLSGLIGLGQGGVEIGVNWSTLRIDTTNSGRPMNLMHGAFAVGAILGPLAVKLLMQSGLGWIIVYRGMAFLFALLAVLMIITPLPATEPTLEEHNTSHAHLSKNPAYWLSFFALFTYVGVELGISNWVAEYFVAVFAYSAEGSAILVSLLWVGLLAGRFGVPLLYTGSHQNVVLVSFSVLATAAVILLSALGYTTISTQTNNMGRLLVFLAGLGFSIYYPTVITLLGKCFPDAQSQVIGFAATGGGIGAFVFPFLMSAVSQTFGIRAGFATYSLFAVVMTLIAIALAISTATKKDRQGQGI